MQPDCLERLVAVGERHPSVGMLGSLRLRGDTIECEGLPRGQECFDGRQVAGWFLRQEVFALAPSSAMFRADLRSEEHTSALQSLMRISYAVFCLKKNNKL